MRGKSGHDPADRAIAALAEAQHGVVSRSQLSEFGLGSRAIDHRLEVGRLRPVHHGVYAILGPRLLPRHGRWLAAVLACGPGAVLSHHAAAALWAIRRGNRIEVTVPRGGRKSRRGIRLHWANVPDDETTAHDGIPTTTVPRTLPDLSAVGQRDELRSAVRQAEQLRLTDRLWLGDLIQRYPRNQASRSSKLLLKKHGRA
jgi:Transcriptional regulator, AbiEi antitoxin